MGVSPSGFGVPSGPGDPAGVDRGVFSASFSRLSKFEGGGRLGVEFTAGVLAESCVPFTEVGVPAAKSMTACCAVGSGSFGDPSYRSTERGMTDLCLCSLCEWSNIEGLKKPCDVQ